MTDAKNHYISIVVPVFNESAGIATFHHSLVAELQKIPNISYEIVYCDDGSIDTTADIIRELHTTDKNIRLVALSRNFGKEYALTAGIAEATGEAVITIDSDGQHPVEFIEKFINSWLGGNQLVIGVRKNAHHSHPFKSLRSKVFYKLFNWSTGEKLIPGASDFRLMDREVQQAFIGLQETGRITRGLIDWLGFSPVMIEFEPHDRAFGTATYTNRQLVKLAVNSFVSLSPVPLYIFGYLGVIITILSLVLGASVLIEQVILRDPLAWRFTGTAMLGILILFLVGIILMSQGILSLYISHVHSQSKRRPLYVINRARSVGIDKK